MNNFIKNLLGKKTYFCNVTACGNEVEYSGAICAVCMLDSEKFKNAEKNLDEWFKQYTSSERLGVLLNYPVPKVEAFDKYVGQQMKELLHRRDEEIAEVVNQMWIRKLGLTQPQ